MLKSIASASLALYFASVVNAHCIITPALGGGTARADVQRPSAAKPCGTVNIAQTLQSSTAAPLAADGTFSATATNFNAGVDGSRQVTAQVDPTGTGNSFVAATVVTNGDKAPTNVGSQSLKVQLPAGTTCSGPGSTCLVSFTTAGKFGNCVAVSSSASASTGAGNSTATPPGNAANSTTTTTPPGNASNSTSTDPGTGTGKKGKGKGKGKGAGAAASASVTDSTDTAAPTDAATGNSTDTTAPQNSTTTGTGKGAGCKGKKGNQNKATAKAAAQNKAAAGGANVRRVHARSFITFTDVDETA